MIRMFWEEKALYSLQTDLLTKAENVRISMKTLNSALKKNMNLKMGIIYLSKRQKRGGKMRKAKRQILFKYREIYGELNFHWFEKTLKILDF